MVVQVTRDAKFVGLNPAIADGTGKKYWMGYGDPYGFGVTATY